MCLLIAVSCRPFKQAGENAPAINHDGGGLDDPASVEPLSQTVLDSLDTETDFTLLVESHDDRQFSYSR